MIHVSLGFITALALYTALLDIEKGIIGTGELFIFLAYVLTMHRRLVQIGRQIARSGKLIANVSRLAQIADLGSSEEHHTPLKHHAIFSSISVKSKGYGNLKESEFIAHAGEKVAVIGESGSGKSTFLSLCSGRLQSDTGQIFWDGEEIDSQDLLSNLSLHYISQRPVFSRDRLSRFLNWSSADLKDKSRKRLVKTLGLSDFFYLLSNGIKSKRSSHQMTQQEARALSILRILDGRSADVSVLDAVLDGFEKESAKAVLDLLIKSHRKRTLLISMSRPVALKSFDRIVVLSRRRIKFTGSYSAYKKWVGRNKQNRIAA